MGGPRAGARGRRAIDGIQDRRAVRHRPFPFRGHHVAAQEGADAGVRGHQAVSRCVGGGVGPCWRQAATAVAVSGGARLHPVRFLGTLRRALHESDRMALSARERAVTPEARRRRSGRVRLGRAVATLTGRPVKMRFHASPSCGGHLPWSPARLLRDCPDAEWDLTREQP